jgi:putative transposase
MSDYRRWRVAGGTYFFTLVTYRRRPILTTNLGRRCLHAAFATVRKRRPFELAGVALLPDHIHAIVALSNGADGYSVRLRRIKEEFTRAFLGAGGREGGTTEGRQRRGERGVWQRRFWEHVIRDEEDFERHLDYIHYNPVKHSHVRCPHEWPFSSFRRWVRRGVYPEDWACGGPPPSFHDLDETAME